MYQVLIVLASVCALAYGLGISLPVAPNDRIVGGTNTSIEAVPYTASLEKNGEHICGASIISKNQTLTAASCVDDDTATYTVRAGSSTLGEGGTVHIVSKITRHPQYTSSSHDYNVAVLDLNGSFPPGQPGSQPIGLSTAEPAAGKKCTISGWGKTSNNAQEQSTQLKSGKVTIVDRTYCRIVYTPDENITDDEICAGVFTDGTDACQGDTGGPLVCDGALSGVVSLPVSCGASLRPSVFANVPALRQWIQSQINEVA